MNHMKFHTTSMKLNVLAIGEKRRGKKIIAREIFYFTH